MKNFWEYISRKYSYPASFNFLLCDEIDIYSSIVAEVYYLLDKGYITEEKDKLVIQKQNIYNLNKAEQYIMRVIACELDFSEKIFTALVIEDAKNSGIVLTDILVITKKFLACFLPFATATVIISVLEYVLHNAPFARSTLAVYLLNITTIFLLIYIYLLAKENIFSIISAKFILCTNTKKEKKKIAKFLTTTKDTPDKYLNIFLQKDNQKHRFVKYII